MGLNESVFFFLTLNVLVIEKRRLTDFYIALYSLIYNIHVQ